MIANIFTSLLLLFFTTPKVYAAACSDSVATFTVQARCVGENSSYQRGSYTCAKDTSVHDLSFTSCQDIEVIYDTAKSQCSSTCPTIAVEIEMPPAPSPSPFPSVTPTSMPETTIRPIPTPSPNCYYQQVKCIKAPCDPILICPTTLSTPISTPLVTSSQVPAPSPTVSKTEQTNSFFASLEKMFCQFRCLLGNSSAKSSCQSLCGANK